MRKCFELRKKFKNLCVKMKNVLSSPIIANICTIILAISTFYSAHVAIKIAFNEEQDYLINNGFYYNYDKEKNLNYKYYNISLTNASINKPINLTGGFSISVSSNKNFRSKSTETTISKTTINDLLNTERFPLNLDYAEKINFHLDENFAKYVQGLYPKKQKYCRKSTSKCYTKPFYIKFCLYDTLNNKYCYIFTEDEINEISKFENGKLY